MRKGQTVKNIRGNMMNNNRSQMRQVQMEDKSIFMDSDESGEGTPRFFKNQNSSKRELMPNFRTSKLSDKIGKNFNMNRNTVSDMKKRQPPNLVKKRVPPQGRLSTNHL
jgi:hypothetical protein